MITGEKKQQVDAIWQTFWNNGFTQPSAIFEHDSPETTIAPMKDRQSMIDAAFSEFQPLLNS